MSSFTDKNIEKNFIKKGFCIQKVENFSLLKKIEKSIYESLKKKVIFKHKNIQEFFNNFHKVVDEKNINSLRLELIENILSKKIFKNYYYEICKRTLEIIVGNELVMQKGINLSIQLPNDETSLLTMHADTWSGDSPYEVVIWLPLVNCNKSKSMYILPANKYKYFEDNFKKQINKSSDNIFKKIRKHVKWVDIRFGEFLIFNQTLPHGNVVNKENETRFSMNCRFKSVFSPYGSKGIGDFFEPISLKPITKIAMEYELPSLKK
jgi:sporadic carbohydrate cluster 2OG-Fe(II) oxygenase